MAGISECELQDIEHRHSDFEEGLTDLALLTEKRADDLERLAAFVRNVRKAVA
jgi:hypothetical protein